MITGVHTIMFGPDADAIRAFLRDVLELREVDAGGGWPIFASPPAEFAAHPSDSGGHYELYLMTDDVEGAVRDLTEKGVEFTGPILDQGWGRVTALKVPGGGELGLYEPHHVTAI
jgi:catechol 2,3-dioxygenase-like lactoylglutathione lyase family enzyme